METEEKIQGKWTARVHADSYRAASTEAGAPVVLKKEAKEEVEEGESTGEALKEKTEDDIKDKARDKGAELLERLPNWLDKIENGATSVAGMAH
jgi:hypothetical protein